MGNPLRNRDPSIYRLITLRTEGAHLWLRPSKDVNLIIGGVLARYSEIFEVVLYAFIFLSNHYHLLIRCPRSNADEFEENLNREIARRLNWKLHKSGSFWARRYSEQEVPSEDDLLEAFLYITTNAVRHGLEANPALWLGLSSYNQSVTETPKTYPFYHYSAQRYEDRITHHTLKVSPLPQFKRLSKVERIAKVQKLVKERVSRLIEERKAAGQGFLGAPAIKAQDPHTKPLEVSKSPRPICYTKDSQVRREFRKQEIMRRDEYDEASMRFRLGNWHVTFPEYTFKPPLHRKPRLLPFKPLPEDYFKIAS